MGRSNVIININQALPTNGNDEISAQDLRGVLIEDVVNKFMNLEDDTEIPVYNPSISYKLGKLVLNQDFIWKALVNAMPTQAPPTLPITSNTYWKVQGSIPLNEATKPEIELETSTKEDVFVSPRRFWEGIARFKALVGTFLEKITFSKGVALGNNATPANGDIWFDNGYFGRQGGVTASLLTSLNGKVGRVLFVSKDGNDSQAVIGNQNFSYFTIQAAVTASTSGDLIIVIKGDYNETVSTSKRLNWLFYNSTLTTLSIDNGNNTRIEGIGSVSITNLILQDDNSGNGNLFVKNINIGTYTIGFRGTINFDNCVINGLSGVLSSVQNFIANNTTINNVNFGNNGNSNNVNNLKAFKCTFNSCIFTKTAVFTFDDCELNNCTIFAWHSRLLFQFCTLRTTIFNYSYSGAIPNVLFNFVLNKCVVSNFTFNNTASTQPTYSLILNIEDAVTTFDFNTIITGNITTEGILQNLVTPARALKFLI